MASGPSGPLQTEPWAQAGRYIDTNEDAGALEGVTRSTNAIPQSDHGLGSAWQVTELEADYDDGGILSIYVATDAQPSDGSIDPFSAGTEADYDIQLSGVPALAGDEDFMVVRIGDGIDGSLDGVAGSFSCDTTSPSVCFFVLDHKPGHYYALTSGVSFTPVGGAAQPVAVRGHAPVPNPTSATRGSRGC